MTDTFSRQKRRWLMSRVRRENTEPELLTGQALRSLGYRYRLHDNDLPGSPDIVLPRRRVAILVHGCFWHGHGCAHGLRRPASNVAFWRNKLARNRTRDRRVVRQLRGLGWRVVIVWECQTRTKERLSNCLRRALGK